MEEKAIQQATKLIFAGLKNNKAGKIIVKDLSEAFNNEILAFWEKLKPWFIKDDPDLVTNLEGDPESPKLQAVAEYKMEGMAKKEEEVKSFIQDFLKRVEEETKKPENSGALTIIGDHNITQKDITNSTITINLGKDHGKGKKNEEGGEKNLTKS